MKKALMSAAGAAVALSLAGGGTFAHWSDTDSYDNSAGAEHLTLDLSNDATQGFVQTAMAPGVNREFDFVVASRNGTVVPSASLMITLENLLGTENGCDGNKEELPAAEGGDDGDCLSPGTSNADGEYADEVRIAINASAPTTDLANACNSSLHPRGGRVSSMSLRDLEDLGAVDLLNGDDLGPGEGICVAMGLTLPTSATNASQGDSATWDFRYDLEQIIAP
jgi:predicted ribosomally synthesized peptide with SipW-like signal peptide